MFAKFSGPDGKTILEYVDQFILQCGDTSANDTLKLRMFFIIVWYCFYLVYFSCS
jgi:hypothetical protein